MLQRNDFRSLGLIALALMVGAVSLRASSAAQAAQTVGHATPPQPTVRPQILWQRTLEDALAISQAEKRPILIAVNMDGETASEQIVRDRYRDPAFVASTERFVCLVASVFRHTPRDYDDQGRRIPCPRLGEVTCGEHMALEPILYDKYLGTKRIAPRHALIQLDGTKTFDLWELFDLRELDKALVAASENAPLRSATLIDESAQFTASAKTNRGRTGFEARLATGGDWPSTLQDVRAHGDAGSLGALRVLLARALSDEESSRADHVASVARIAADLGIGAPLAESLRARLMGPGKFPGAAGLDADAALLPALASLDAKSPATRSLLLAYAALGTADDSHAARLALGAPSTDGLPALDPATTVEAILRLARTVTDSVPLVARARDPLPSVEELEATMADAEQKMRARPNDAGLQAEYGRASLGLARHGMETGAKGVQLFLEDARTWLGRAATRQPKDVALLLDRARTSYYLSDFAEEERLALEAFAPGLPKDCSDSERLIEFLSEPKIRASAKSNTPPLFVETLRWLGDASARLLETRSGGDARVEYEGIARGGMALGLAAASPSADESDWQSYASFFGALGMAREELAAYQEGAARLPESDALRTALNAALWRAGRIDLTATKADWLASRNPKSGACAWHAGYAYVLVAEDLRRGEKPDASIEAYRCAEERFRRAIELAPQFADNTTHYLALCALGRGFAHLLSDRRAEAARCLAEGIAIRPSVVSARDGLDREAVDLLDNSLEFKAGKKSPVDALMFLADLEKADPRNAFWARSISDSELREGLRAAGRGDDAETQRYLDVAIAAGRRAVATDAADENRKALAQAITIVAEFALQRSDVATARTRLAEAAPLLGESAPAADADEKALTELSAKLRQMLGAARPRFRPGR